MRIGVNTLFLIPGEVGGSQTYLCETLRYMIRLFPTDSYILFTQADNDGFLRDLFAGLPGVTFERLDFRAVNRSARIIREQVELPRKVGRHRPDVLWSPGYTAPARCMVPQVVSILDMQYKRFPNDMSPLGRYVMDLLLRVAAGSGNRILTISRFSKAEIRRFLDIPEERITVTPLAADRLFSHPSSAGHAALGKEAFLLCVANSYPHKNLDGLVRAFAFVKHAKPLKLVIVGKPRRGENQVQQALSTLPESVREDIVRIERTTREELVGLYQNCAAFVFPSLYEGFGLPLLEAMLAGAPVVASDGPALREVGSVWARYCDPCDPRALATAIEAVLAMPSDQRMARISGARKHASTFSWDMTARKTHAVLKQAAKEKEVRQDDA